MDVISAEQATDSMSYPMTGGTVVDFYESGRLAVQKGGRRMVIIKNQNCRPPSWPTRCRPE